MSFCGRRSTGGHLGGRISESSIREIRDRADIVEVISETVPLARSGSGYRGLCPFHREKTPSFHVHPSRQIFHCFGCGEGGSVFHFLMKARNLGFAEAVEDLADRYGIALKYEQGSGARQPGEELHRVLRFAADFYRDMLRKSPSGEGARELVRKRGVGPEAEQEFFLGYGGGGNDLIRALGAEGIDLAQAEKAGLLLPKEGGGFRERFRGRLLFPITDARGRVCGFGGRAMGDAQPKYLNSPESPLYKKSAVLYGLFQALRPIRSEGRVLVVEGYLDLISLWQKGVRNVVATCGTSLTEQHARMLKRLAEEVVLFFDGDFAGEKAAGKAGAPLYAAGVSPLVLFPPPGQDPDDWAKALPPSELARKVAGAIPLLQHIEARIAEKFDLGEIRGKLAYLRRVAPYVAWVTDAAERRLYVKRLAGAVGLPEDDVDATLKRVAAGVAQHESTAPTAHHNRPGAAQPGGSPPSPAVDSCDEMLLRLLAADPGLIRRAADEGLPGLVSDEGVRRLLALLAARADSGDIPTLDGMLDDESVPDDVRRRITGALAGGIPTAEKARESYPETALEMRIRERKREIERLGRIIREAESPGEREAALGEQIAAHKEIENLKRKRIDLTR
ncbi:MAG TPA: DNA primase [Candidatus Deferrimicrobiaceae bacterium]